MNQKYLPKEIVSLLHHVELNQAGWRGRAIQNLILGTLWLHGGSMSPNDIIAKMCGEFGDFDPTEIKSQIDNLCSSGQLVHLTDGRVKLTEHTTRLIEGKLQESEKLQEQIKERFITTVNRHCPGINSGDAWFDFENNTLIPTVRELGARTYELISGAIHRSSLVKSLGEEFFQRYPLEYRHELQDAISEFLDVNDSPTRAYILGLLNAYFFTQAIALDEVTVSNLVKAGEAPSFTLFLDTNLLFSILNLHENPSNEAVKSLMELLPRLSGKVSVKLFATPVTINEAKRVLIAVQQQLQGLRLTPNLREAAENSFEGGFVPKYLEALQRAKNLTLKDYLQPYIDGFSRILQEKGVQIFQEDMNEYKTRQNVIDDILRQMDFEERNYKTRAKSYHQVEHDMILWHFVIDKRASLIENVLDAHYWIVTIDFRLLGFDNFQCKARGNGIPICIHPANLVHLLQFWIPRTPELEKAIFSSIRLPFFVQEFDLESEKAAIRILETLGRFENVEDLSTDTVRNLLIDKGLKQRLIGEENVEKQIKLVREALIEEYREMEEEFKITRQKASELGEAIQKKDEIIQQLDQEVGRLRSEIDKEQEDRKHLEERISKLEMERQREKAAREIINRFVSFWVAIPWILMITGAFILSGLISRIAKVEAILSWIGVFSLMLIAWLWLIDWRGKQDEALATWGPFTRLLKVKKWLFTILGAIVLGILGNFLWEMIKKLWL